MMAESTSISWTDATWSPVTGCTKVSPGCAHCYIERTPPMRMAGRKFVGGRIPVQLHPGRLEQPLHWRKPRRVFVPSMGDLFHEDVPDEFIWEVFCTMLGAKEHIFQVLTKRPQRMRDVVSDAFDPRWGKTPLPNVHLGVTAENQRWADERIPILLDTPAAHYFVSLEPLLGPIDLHPRPRSDLCLRCGEGPDVPHGHPEGYRTHGLDLVIVAGESGGPPDRALVERCDCAPTHAELHKRGMFLRHWPCQNTGWRPKPEALEWVRSLRDQCLAAGVSFHFKGWGGPTPNSGGHLLDGKKWRDMPA